MSKEEIEKIELERDFYNIMTSYGKLGYKINKTIDELNEINELSNLMAKEKKELQDRIQKAIEYIEKLLKEEFEVTNVENIDYGKKFQRAYFSDSELGKIKNILQGSGKDDK